MMTTGKLTMRVTRMRSKKMIRLMVMAAIVTKMGWTRMMLYDEDQAEDENGGHDDIVTSFCFCCACR